MSATVRETARRWADHTHERECDPASWLPHCPACAALVHDGGFCGRDECPGEATRPRATFGAPPPPRQPADWKRRTGLRLGGGKVEEIVMDKPSCIALTQHPPEVIAYNQALLDDLNGRPRPVTPTPWAVRAWRRLRERWVGMWARIAQFMGVDLDG